MRLVLLGFVFLTLASHALGQTRIFPNAGRSCSCTEQYIPFCGTDGVTYPNKCSLDCARSTVRGLAVKFEGVCAEPYRPNNGGAEPNYYKPPPIITTQRPYYTTTRRSYYPTTTQRSYYTTTQRPYYPTTQPPYQPPVRTTRRPYTPTSKPHWAPPIYQG